MAYMNVGEHQVYYECHGEGDRALVILNGIMMSSTSWQPFLGMLTKYVKVVLIDFYDQGKSTFMTENYTQALQVELVESFLSQLSLKETTLLGISYGGEIAMQVASRSPELLNRLILANTTAYTDPQLKAIGESWINAAKTYDGRQFFKATIPPIYSSGFYARRLDWLNAREDLFVRLFDERWYEGFIRLVISAESHDARQMIKAIKHPVLIIGADEDLITPISCQEALVRQIEHATFLVIKACGHAAMYEKPIEFFTAVLGFIFTSDEAFTI